MRAFPALLVPSDDEGFIPSRVEGLMLSGAEELMTLRVEPQDKQATCAGVPLLARRMVP